MIWLILQLELHAKFLSARGADKKERVYFFPRGGGNIVILAGNFGRGIIEMPREYLMEASQLSGVALS